MELLARAQAFGRVRRDVHLHVHGGDGHRSGTGAGAFAGLAIGFVLMVMVFAGGHISGAHYNPAVSTAVLIRGKMTSREWGAYVITQLVAAALAGALARSVGGHEAAAATANDGKMFIVELIFTFALAYTVLNVATAQGTEGNSFYGLAIGGIVVVGAYAVGGISGGGFNPAIALGASITGLFQWSHYWIYLIAPLMGAGAAAVFFVYVQEAEKPEGDLEAAGTGGAPPPDVP